MQLSTFYASYNYERANEDTWQATGDPHLHYQMNKKKKIGNKIKSK